MNARYVAVSMQYDEVKEKLEGKKKERVELDKKIKLLEETQQQLENDKKRIMLQIKNQKRKCAPSVSPLKAEAKVEVKKSMKFENKFGNDDELDDQLLLNAAADADNGNRGDETDGSSPAKINKM